VGIIVTANDMDIPFPRRLFAAMAQHAITQGLDEGRWRALHQMFETQGCCLALSDLTADDLIAFKSGVALLARHLETVDEFAGFDAPGICMSLILIERSFET